MNKIELQKQSLNIEEVSDNVVICDHESLKFTFEIIKAIRKQKERIIEYWKNTKESAKKAYQAISNKEKEMLEICENSEKLLKEKILTYNQRQEKRQKELIDQAEDSRKNQLKNILAEASELEKQGKYKEAERKLAESEKLKRINLSLDLFSKENKITTQKRWKCKVTDNKSVPCFFDGIEIREINTKKLLEVRKKDPEVTIPGVEFYTEENLIIRSV